MTAVDSFTTKEIIPNAGVKMIQVVTSSDADDTETLTVDLSDYGCTNIHGILGFQESTAGSVVTTEEPTTTVSSSTLTITIGGSDNDKVRSFIIFAY